MDKKSIKKSKSFDIVERLSIVVFSVSKDIIIIFHSKMVGLKKDIYKKKLFKYKTYYNIIIISNLYRIIL